MRSGWLIVALICAGGLVGAGCSGKDHGQDKAAAPPPIVRGALLETARLSTAPETLEIVGTVRAGTSAVVSARIPGAISVLKAREGERVKKGQLLARLDARESLASAAGAAAGTEEAQRGLDEAIARKRLADTTFERYQNLFREQAVTRQEFDVKQTEKELAAQGVARAEARLKQARENSRAAGALADYTRIVSPISGVVTSRQADLGATVFPAQPLFTIEDENSYMLELAVPDSLAAAVKPGTRVQVSLDSTAMTSAGTIAEVVPASDPASRTFIAKVRLPGKNLRSGMFARGLIATGTTSNSVLVPKNALMERGGLTMVWVVGSDTIARLRIVKQGKRTDDRVEILSGLSDGERVVVSGVEKVIEGAKVE